MDSGSWIIGFGGLVVAGLSVYLSYKAKTSPYREVLYSKQLDGYAEVVDALTDFYIAAQSFIAAQGCRLDNNSRPTLRLQTMDKAQVFHHKHQKWAIFLPKEMNEKLSAFVKLFNGISAPAEVAKQYPSEIVYANDPGGLLGNAYIKVIESARKSLGTEALSQETLKLIGEVHNN
jgi:hypothetical protein